MSSKKDNKKKIYIYDYDPDFAKKIDKCLHEYDLESEILDNIENFDFLNNSCLLIISCNERFLDFIKLDTRQYLPVIVTGDCAQISLIKTFLSRGIYDYLIKDSSFFQLLPVVIDRVVKYFEEENIIIELDKEKKETEVTVNALLNATRDSAMLIDPDGTVNVINEIAAKKIGVSAQELIGKSVFGYFPPELAEFRKKIGNEIMKKPHAFRFEEVHENSIYDNNIYPVLDDEGRIKKLAIFAQDITERKRTEKALQESEEKFRALIENSADGILILDKVGHITYASPSVKVILGYDPEVLIGKSVFNYVYEDDAELIRNEYFDPNRNSDFKKIFEVRTRHRSSGYKFIGVVVSNMLNNPMVNGVIINFRDITERKEAENVLRQSKDELEQIVEERTKELKNTNRKLLDEIKSHVKARIELEKAKEEAEIANKTKSQFLANMSHEIRTPLNSILGFTDILLEKEVDTGNTKKLEIISQAGKILLALINDILDFSKIESGRLEFDYTNFSIRDLFNNIYSMFIVNAREKNIDFEILIDSSVPLYVYGDKYRFEQVVLNLLSNAFKFTKKGLIAVECEKRNEFVHIEVSDTGIGISEDKLNLIFSSFSQADASTTREYGGTGLGLAITKSLVEKMGGKISVESRINKGSTFRVELFLPEVTDNVLIDTTREYNGNQMVESWLATAQGSKKLRKTILNGIKTIPERLENLGNAIDNSDINEIKYVAHKLKGFSGSYGMTEIYENAVKIDEEIVKPQYDLELIKKLFGHLKEIERAIPESYFYLPENREEIDKRISKGKSDFKILIAEDDRMNRALVGALLEDMDLYYDFAGNGKIALEMLIKEAKESSGYDLLILDMQMPVMDGVETVSRLRVDKKISAIHVIAFTAHALEGDAEKYLDAGCDDYISKPVDKKEFRNKINKLIIEKLKHKKHDN